MDGYLEHFLCNHSQVNITRPHWWLVSSAPSHYLNQSCHIVILSCPHCYVLNQTVFKAVICYCMIYRFYCILIVFSSLQLTVHCLQWLAFVKPISHDGTGTPTRKPVRSSSMGDVEETLTDLQANWIALHRVDPKVGIMLLLGICWIMMELRECVLLYGGRIDGQATGLDAWASRVKCPARFVSHLHEICIYIYIYMSCL